MYENLGNNRVIFTCAILIKGQKKKKPTKLFGSISVAICIQYKFKVKLHKWGKLYRKYQKRHVSDSVFTEKFGTKKGVQHQPSRIYRCIACLFLFKMFLFEASDKLSLGRRYSAVDFE
jgi:hypothetical protein